MTEWTSAARDALLRHRSPEGGWGYSPGGEAFVEPTALAGLALSAARQLDAEDRAVREAAAWLARLQKPDGSFGLSSQWTTPCWATPHAVLFLSVLDGYDAQCAKAARWLLEMRGKAWPAETDSVIGHDTGIPGWPWVDGTHSWLEPTAMAVLALRRAGWERHPRVRDGLRLVRDRAISTGAWNYGNREIFGTSLRPQPAPTGIALLALAGSGPPDDLVERGCRYLCSTLPRVRACRSLAWGLLGLEAWNERPSEAGVWLAESFAAVERHRPTPVDVAQLLLAASGATLQLLAVRSLEGSPAR